MPALAQQRFLAGNSQGHSLLDELLILCARIGFNP